MKVPEKPIKVAQLHLPLLAAPKAPIYDEKQRELAVDGRSFALIPIPSNPTATCL